MTRKVKTFKKLVEQISQIKSYDDCQQAYADISFSYQHDTFNYKDEELLIALLQIAYKAYPEN